MTTRVGFIGLGRIGKPMAINVAKAGFDLMVYDVREEPLKEAARLGAKVARSLKEAGRHGEIVEVAVVDDSQVEEVVSGDGGLLEVAAPGTIIAIHSTILPKTAKKVSEMAEAKGIKVLDAQVSGGEQGARERVLCYMVGGDKDVVETCRPVFSTSAANIFHMGELGMGATTKIVQQVIVCINMLAASEAFFLAEKTGLNFDSLQQVIHVSAGQSFVADKWFERFKIEDEPLNVKRQRVEVFSKSLSPALDLARDLGLSLPGAALTQQLLARALGIDEK
ncbi:MAG: NAD(P)-dependent oxidoreductase [Candidatus Binatia bacterium]